MQYRRALLLIAVPSCAAVVLAQGGDRWPAGSERAVAAVAAAEPDAAIRAVVRGKSIGLPGDDMVLWTIELQGGTKIDASGDGVLVHRSKPVRDIDLPTLVGNGKAKVAPAGTKQIVKRETLGVLRYIAMRKPRTTYEVRVATAAGTKSVAIDADGKVLRVTDAKPEPAPAPAPAPANARHTDAPIPELAAGAVSAVRGIYPGMRFDLVEEVPYVDGTTQTIEMLWYEVEFVDGGQQYEINATPDGVVITYHKPIPTGELPVAVAATVAAELPGGKLEDVVKHETRGMPRFVALERPVTVYDVTPQDGSGPIKLRLDGTEVKEPEWPDWVKKATKKGS